MITVALLIARILDEEHALSADLPGYDDYHRAVRYRLIPLRCSDLALAGATETAPLVGVVMAGYWQAFETTNESFRIKF